MLKRVQFYVHSLRWISSTSLLLFFLVKCFHAPPRIAHEANFDLLCFFQGRASLQRNKVLCCKVGCKVDQPRRVVMDDVEKLRQELAIKDIQVQSVQRNYEGLSRCMQQKQEEAANVQKSRKSNWTLMAWPATLLLHCMIPPRNLRGTACAEYSTAAAADSAM